MLDIEQRSLQYVCYRASEAADTELQRLLSELSEAGVCLIELDAWERVHGTAARLLLAAPDPARTLLLSGTPETLALAADTRAATVGYGALCTASGECCTRAADMLVLGFDEADVGFLERIARRAQGLPWVILRTARTLLREQTLSDLDALYGLYGGAHVTDYLKPLSARAEEEAALRSYITHMYGFCGYGMWLVCARENGAVIGRAGFSHRELSDETVLEMGYLIAEPYQRQGYATEVCRALISHAREELSAFGELNCFVAEGNAVSHALMRRLHFSPEQTVSVEGRACVRYVLRL